MTGDKAANEVFVTKRQISTLRQKIYITKLIVAQLANEYDPELVRILREELFFFVQEPINLDEVLSLLMTDEIALEIAEADLAKLSTNDKKATRADYAANLAALGKFQGYRIDPNLVTLSEYVAISNNFAKHIEFLKRNPHAAVIN